MEQEAVEAQEIKREASELVNQAHSMAVRNAADFEAAGKILVAIKRVRKAISDTFDPIREKAHAAWKEVIAQQKKHDDPLEVAEKLLGRVMGQFQAEAEAERQRLIREEQKRLDEERRQAQVKADAERATQLKADEDARLAHAIALEAEGKKAEAARVLNAPPPPPPPPPAQPKQVSAYIHHAPKAAGVSFRDNWKARVVDKEALVKACAAGTQPLTLLTPDQKVLDGIAKALKGEARIPGVEFYSENVTAVRA